MYPVGLVLEVEEVEGGWIWTPLAGESWGEMWPWNRYYSGG